MGFVLFGALGLLVGWLAGQFAVLVPEGEWKKPAAYIAALGGRRRMEHYVGAALCAASFGGAWLLSSSDGDLAATVLLLPLLIAILLVDLRHHLVYPLMPLLAGLLGVVLAPLGGEVTVLSALVGALAGAAAFFAIFLLGLVVFRVQALGFGDVLLAGMIGGVVGFFAMPGALVLGTVISAAASLGLLATRKKGMRDYIPFGSGMCLAAIIVLLTRS